MKHTLTLTAGELGKILADAVVARLGLPTQLYRISYTINMQGQQVTLTEVTLEEPSEAELRVFARESGPVPLSCASCGVEHGLPHKKTCSFSKPLKRGGV